MKIGLEVGLHQIQFYDKSKETTKKFHKGLMYSDLKIYKNNIDIKLIDGIVWSTVPNVPGRLFIKNNQRLSFCRY